MDPSNKIRRIFRDKSLRWEIFVVLLIIFFGIFLRAYRFTPWLHFEVDQTFDFNTVSPAVKNGIGNLPLLGPTAGGGRSLRLGPAVYYMEYLSAKIFGNTPQGHAIYILLSSFAFLPFFYFFCCRYFKKETSIALLAIASFSVYLVLYSRFGWSPNSLPFFMTASLFAMLKSVSRKEKRRDIWFLVGAALISITTQIHYNAFFTLPAIVALFLIIKRPRFKMKTWILGVCIVAATYSPMIFSDIRTNGQNVGYFFQKMKKNPADQRSLGYKIERALRYDVMEYSFISSGQDLVNAKDSNIEKTYSKLWSESKPELLWEIFWTVLLIAEIFLLAKNAFEEKDEEKKDFLILLSLWFSISCLFFFSLLYRSYEILHPRFFLIISPLAVILFGFILDLLQKLTNRKMIILSLIVLLLALPNLKKISDTFRNLTDAESISVDAETEDIFPNTNRVTFEEETNIANYIESKQKENGYPVYIYLDHKYEMALWYFLEKDGTDYYGKMNPRRIYAEGNYFIIYKTSAGDPAELKADTPYFDIVERKNFGLLSVYQLSPRPDSGKLSLRQEASQKEIPDEISNINQLYTWKKALPSIFGR